MDLVKAYANAVRVMMDTKGISYESADYTIIR